MTWTYTANPANVPLDALRLIIGDTQSADPQMQDEELNYLSAGTTVTLAAATACEALAARYARQADRTVGDISLSASQRSKAYMALATTLRARRTAKGSQMLVGGLSVAEKQAANQDTSATQPAFARGQYDAPGVPQPSNDPTLYTYPPRGT